MIEILEALKQLSGRMTKGLAIEYYMKHNRSELVIRLRDILNNASVTSTDIRQYVLEGVALPIPPEAFEKMKGLEDYLETIEPGRIFEWLLEARPDLGKALMDLGDQAAEYVVRFKMFMIDSIKNAAGEPEPTEEAQHVDIPGEEENSPPVIPFHLKYASAPEPSPSAPAEAPPAAERKTKKVTCEHCGDVRYGTPEEAERWSNEPCPNCGQ